MRSSASCSAHSREVQRGESRQTRRVAPPLSVSRDGNRLGPSIDWEAVRTSFERSWHRPARQREGRRYQDIHTPEDVAARAQVRK